MFVRVGWARSNDGSILSPPHTEWEAAKRDPRLSEKISEVFDAEGKVDPDKLEEWLLNHRIGKNRSESVKC